MTLETDHLSPAELAELDRLLLAETPVLPHLLYQHDPIGWAVDKLAIPEHTLRWSLNAGYDRHQWDGDVDPLVQLAQALASGTRMIGCESGTGTGKSFSLAVLIYWFVACFQGARVFTFAPKEDQLRLFIWMEMQKLFPRFQAHFPSAKLTADLRLQMVAGLGDWGAEGYAVGIKADEFVSTKAAGMHAPHMMLVYEEAPGIPVAVYEAGENTCTAPHNIRVAVGNPNFRLDPLHKFCVTPGAKHIRMSGLDHPNVVTGLEIVPGAVSRISIEQRLAKYGVTSPVYQSRVRGESPDQASDALIRLEWLESSAARFEARRLLSADSQPWIQGVESPETRQSIGGIPRDARGEPVTLAPLSVVVTGKGVDVANSEHGDRACIVDFAGNAVVRVSAFQCPDANALGRKVKLEMDASGLDPIRVGVDAIGVGAGTVNELRRLGRVVQGLNNGGSPMVGVEKEEDGRTWEWSPDVNLFKNFRSQSYWQLREDFRLGGIDMAKDDELWEELLTPTFVDEPKTVVEPKDEIRERLGRSPDKADALVMANWVRKRAVVVAVVERKPGHTAGMDWAAQKPREKETAEDEMRKLLQRAQPNIIGSRYSVPSRRGR